MPLNPASPHNIIKGKMAKDDIFCQSCGRYLGKDLDLKEPRFCNNKCKKAYERRMRPKSHKKYSAYYWTH